VGGRTHMPHAAEDPDIDWAADVTARLQVRRHPEVRTRLEEAEDRLSPFAARSRASRGRERAEPLDPLRTAFQRDRDRIIHSKAFRRLKHKTQVFIAPLGDHYRTRLTHTVEVVQVARSIARALNLNEDLTEAIALGHDLGHTPFGHAGEEALAEVLPGGFRHNEQSVRVVEVLEKSGQGLNLTWEVRDGILRHSKVRESIAAEAWGIAATLEGQVVKVADSLAYLAHDLDDARRAGLLRRRRLPSRFERLLGSRTSQMIDVMVSDVVDYNWRVAEGRGDDWRAAVGNGVAVAPSPELLPLLDELREFMFRNVYRDSEAQRDVPKARFVLHTLYDYYSRHPEELPSEPAQNPRGEPLERLVADHFASMTDRYALAEFERLFLPRAWSAPEEPEVRRYDR
jgi:dGTPase